MELVIRKIICFVVLSVMASQSYANISIPFDLINGLIIVKAEINGTTGNFIIDSGSNGILLNGTSEKSDISYQTLNSTLDGSETKIESFKVGDFEVGELLGFSTDLSNLELFLDKSIAGILGCSIFTPNSLVFDFADSKMIISDRTPDTIETSELASLSFEIVEDLPIAQISIDGRNHAFILDSGASSHFIDAALIDQFKNEFVPTGVEKSIITAGGEDQSSLEYSIPKFKIGNSNSTIKAFEKDFKLVSETLGKDISGLLSLSKLSSGMVYFDLKSNTLFYN